MKEATRPAATRDDIEWVMGSNGPFLRDKPEWSARRTREIERDREDERRRFNYRHEQAEAERG